MADIDSILLVSFGGPEHPDDVLPFLRIVTAGRNVPDERLTKVAGQYEKIGGRSPINDQARELIAAMRAELDTRNVDLPIYWGNRNWDPFLATTMKEMAADGRRHAVAFVTSAYSSYSGCRQYLEDIDRARAEVGPDAPEITKIGQFYDEPGFIEPFARKTADALQRIGTDSTAIVFTAHSIPLSMAAHCRYESQLMEAAQLVVKNADISAPWSLVYQSRSGSPHVPWLEPDINEHLAELKEKGFEKVVVVPVGFISDHVEVMYDLDIQARKTAANLGLQMERIGTPGTDREFIVMIGDLITKELDGTRTSRCLGQTCCLAH